MDRIRQDRIRPFCRTVSNFIYCSTSRQTAKFKREKTKNTHAHADAFIRAEDAEDDTGVLVIGIHQQPVLATISGAVGYP